MAAGTIKTKGQLTTDIDSIIVAGGNIDAVDLNGILQNIVASYEDIIRDYTTVQRDALTPVESQIIYNTTSNRLEYYSASMWLPCSQKETIAVDCSANPNYPEALCGDQYIVTVAGKIGGGSGADVHVGDLVTCTVANAGGTQASVGSSWKITYSNGGTATLKSITVNIPTAEVLTLNTIPVDVSSSIVVAGKGLKVVSAICKIQFNSVAYATNTNLVLGCSTTYPQASCSINASISTWLNMDLLSGAIIVPNDILSISVETGNPTAGNSDISIVIYYLEV